MGKLQVNYNYHLHQQAWASRNIICYQHAYMHTHNEPGLNVNLWADLKTNFTWTPPLAAQQTKICLKDPKAITDEELEVAFAKLEQCNLTDAWTFNPVIKGNNIEAKKVYNLNEFARVEKCMILSTLKMMLRWLFQPQEIPTGILILYYCQKVFPQPKILSNNSMNFATLLRLHQHQEKAQNNFAEFCHPPFCQQLANFAQK